MKYLTNKQFPSIIVGVVLGWEERDHRFFQEYMEIRDFHYTHKNQWEPEGGEDEYDPHSTFVLVVELGHVVAGCRIISDDIGLPVRDVLREHGLPIDQIPDGSCEISRFVVHPMYLGKRETAEYVRYLTSCIQIHCKKCLISEAYAVMISVLEKWMQRLEIPVFPLSTPAVIRHGDQQFRTVRFPSQ